MKILPILLTTAVWSAVAVAGNVPAGTDVSIRTSEYIRTSEATPNRTFSANIQQDIMDESGAVAIPKASEAALTVRKISKGELAIDLVSVTVNGIKYSVDCDEIDQANQRDGVGKNKRTGVMVGGGAALGAIVGAIAGGGKGAAIGAAAGAGAGGATQTLTRGKEVKLPTESVLTFRLSKPLTVAAKN
ncbi:MAG: hypothetical protein HY820_45210 [Acidobacteria bacterium]|nr:hypothetical protein [Acidobacteriota bacterium]